MGCCNAKDSSAVLIISSGVIKDLPKELYNYIETFVQHDDFSILGLSNCGTPFTVCTEQNWKDLCFAQGGDTMVLLVNSFNLSDILNIKLTQNRKFDSKFKITSQQLTSYAQLIDKFDTALQDFLQKLSNFFIGAYSFPTAIEIFHALLSPYYSKITKSPPYIDITEEQSFDIPRKTKRLYMTWQKLMDLLEEFEEISGIITHNLNYLIRIRQGKLQTDLRIKLFRGIHVHRPSVQLAENNFKLNKALHMVNQCTSQMEVFKQSITDSLGQFQDEKQMLTKRIGTIVFESIADSPQAISSLFGLGDYVLVAD